MNARRWWHLTTFLALGACTDNPRAEVTSPEGAHDLSAFRSQTGSAVFTDAADRISSVVEDQAMRRELHDRLHTLALAMRSGRSSQVRAALSRAESALARIRPTPDNEPDLDVIRESLRDARQSLTADDGEKGGTPR